MNDDPDGGEPLLRRDILEIVQRAAARGLGRRRHQRRASRRTWRGAWPTPAHADSRCSMRSIRSARPLQEGAGRLAQHRRGSGDPRQDRASVHRPDDRRVAQSRRADAIADFAHDRLAAKVWNLYFLVPTGRGQFVSDMTPAHTTTCSPLYRIQRKRQRPDAREREVRAALHQDASSIPAPAAIRSRPTANRRRAAPLVSRRSERIPGGPAGARRERTTWGYDRTGTSRPAPTSPSSRARRSASLADPGPRRSCSTTFGAARRSEGGAACEMNAHCGAVARATG